MARKHELNPEEYTIDEVIAYSNKEFEGIRISWSGPIGFGQYEFYKSHEDNKWCIDSEHMDIPDDKEFGKMLLNKFINEIKDVS